MSIINYYSPYTPAFILRTLWQYRDSVAFDSSILPLALGRSNRQFAFVVFK